ncbi:MAG: DUF302 domain-containing protein [Candidatus Eremiobacteraeota bacterium]|nr:DUF302 domain-containing protein [Candidatus Eremiobacteraeota bacterium]
MSYYFTTKLSVPFDEAVAKVIEAFKAEGFGVLTDINVKETMEKKLGVTFRNYRILGMCNPPFAHKALMTEDKIGLLLPCNVIVQDHGQGDVEVSAIDPYASMAAVQNKALGEVASEVRERLKHCIEGLGKS